MKNSRVVSISHHTDELSEFLRIDIILDILRIVRVFKPFVDSNISLMDVVNDVLFDDLHTLAFARLHHRWDLMQLIFTDKIGNRGVFGQDFFRKPES